MYQNQYLNELFLSYLILCNNNNRFMIMDLEDMGAMMTRTFL